MKELIHFIDDLTDWLLFSVGFGGGYTVFMLAIWNETLRVRSFQPPDSYYQPYMSYLDNGERKAVRKPQACLKYRQQRLGGMERVFQLWIFKPSYSA